MKKSTLHNSRRTSPHHAKHKKQSYLKVYWPYIPVFILLGLGFVAPKLQISHSQSSVVANKSNGVLAYATNTSINGLLSGTNTQRAANGAGALSLNSKLNSAAQAKANDMVARNYWSHNTPEGNPPWVFIQNAGYTYNKAGENLAYGFETSDATIAGWMNSPTHKANLIDVVFKEVGFGIANSADYQSNGNETVVVAMYGDPYSSPAAAPAPSPTPTVAAATKSAPNNPPTAKISSSTPSPTTSPVPAANPVTSALPTSGNDTVTPVGSGVPGTGKNKIMAYTTDSSSNPTTKDTKVSRLQSLTQGRALWGDFALSMIIVTGLAVYVFKHAIAIKKSLIHGEQFVVKHPLFDIILVAVIASAMYLASQAGRVL